MRRDHIFYVASLTKTFAAVMTMQYVQERKIALRSLRRGFIASPTGRVRKYLWMAIQCGQVVGSRTESLEAIVTKMHR